MNKRTREEQRRLVGEHARKQLDEGTWPEVMGVFLYKNPMAARMSEADFAQLKGFYENAQCLGVAEFVDILRFLEIEHGVTISFNFSMRSRISRESKPPPTAEKVRAFFATPDILVGTRNGVAGAAKWLINLSAAVPHLAPEAVQVMDKVFAEAVLVLKGPAHPVSAEDLLKAASGNTDVLKPSDKTKH